MSKTVEYLNNVCIRRELMLYKLPNEKCVVRNGKHDKGTSEQGHIEEAGSDLTE